MGDATNAVAAIRDAAGGSVRIIATYDRDGYDVVYLRDDVESKVASLAEGVHEELVIREVGRDYLEELFEAGALHCSMHRFEEMTAFHFIEGGFTGLFVSIDSDADVPLASFAETCRAQLE
ncbi:hypothetical protein [Halarchaeum sp. CBA1220]|uniref:hypothetical protein n=1 Tax=Halarchaeum sp. CBA1220 TaxID=1853682 RepID=UPI002103D4D7|nr:hypothetical protein [Halarchaeum sp. CBA1220]